MHYASTNDADDEETEEFFDRAWAVMRHRTEKKIVVIVGNFNETRLATHRQWEIQSRGKEWEWTTPHYFCDENNLFIGQTLFAHKMINKRTWAPHDRHTHNQIDHICIGQNFRISLLDVREKREADAASDYHFMVWNLQPNLQRFADINARTKYNVDCLKERNNQEKYTEQKKKVSFW